MNFEIINQLSTQQATEFFMQCCTTESWVNRLVNSRPFTGNEQIKSKADELWKNLDEADYLQAFEGHPKIGDVNSLRKKYANTKKLASGEQQSVNEASEMVLLELSKGNDDYQAKFGFIFIVCATGKSAEQMLGLLQKRLVNDRATELVNAIEEQRKIFQIRLDKAMEQKQ